MGEKTNKQQEGINEVLRKLECRNEQLRRMDDYILKNNVEHYCNFHIEYNSDYDEIQVLHMESDSNGEIHIPDFVDVIKLEAWNEECEECTIFIPVGCNVEIAETDVYTYPSWGIAEYAKQVVVDKKHQSLSSKNGVLFNKEKTELLAYPAFKKNKTYTIPSNVTWIKVSSFWKNTFIKKLNTTILDIHMINYLKDLNYLNGVEIIKK